MTDDFSGAERLTFQHLKAIHELQQKKDKWEKLKKEYGDLREKLTSFPLKLRHEYKVPIGSVGFFEGQIIHTNEIMVLLGDNWFTQCSAHHAIQIVDHRIQVVEKNLKDVCEEINFLESRMKTVEGLSTMDKAEGIVDIREESSHKSRQSKGKKHIAHKSTHNIKPRSLKDLDREKRENSGKKELPKPDSEQDSMVVERLFARLDELEIEEKTTALKEHEARMKELKPDKENHVRFKDNEEDNHSFVNDSTSDMVNNEEENCIRFKHTKAGREATEERDLPSSGKPLVNGNEQRFISPADIYAQFMKPQANDIDEKPLKSILKKERKHSNEGLKPKPILKHSPEHKSDGSSGDELSIAQANEDPKPILKAGHEAVCGTVIERVTDGSTNQTNKELPRKKVSRFKASRMKK